MLWLHFLPVQHHVLSPFQVEKILSKVSKVYKARSAKLTVTLLIPFFTCVYFISVPFFANFVLFFGLFVYFFSIWVHLKSFLPFLLPILACFFKTIFTQSLSISLKHHVLSAFQTEKILPSVKSLQSPLSEGDSCIIDGWECGYVTDLDKWCSLGKSGNVSQTPMGLLRGFFNFYANFDYKNCVISPYHGDPISDQTELHDLTSFCIQVCL